MSNYHNITVMNFWREQCKNRALTRARNSQDLDRAAWLKFPIEIFWTTSKLILVFSRRHWILPIHFFAFWVRTFLTLKSIKNCEQVTVFAVFALYAKLGPWTFLPYCLDLYYPWLWKQFVVFCNLSDRKDNAAADQAFFHSNFDRFEMSACSCHFLKACLTTFLKI
jgi:hypothetical protein